MCRQYMPPRTCRQALLCLWCIFLDRMCSFCNQSKILFWYFLARCLLALSNILRQTFLSLPLLALSCGSSHIMTVSTWNEMQYRFHFRKLYNTYFNYLSCDVVCCVVMQRGAMQCSVWQHMAMYGMTQCVWHSPCLYSTFRAIVLACSLLCVLVFPSTCLFAPVLRSKRFLCPSLCLTLHCLSKLILGAL